ncbi:aspartic proteinase 36 isoform X2 [Coffea arabica]|uniref:Aspartic proteinase 36 isoform X2 n=1 Tax=Coffea arabica TaxID=13443 RepID=A0A6P6WVG0_COFAR|nr:aspartic proteinase-like protein 2 isoform X2 [Coffea arabica]
MNNRAAIAAAAPAAEAERVEKMGRNNSNSIFCLLFLVNFLNLISTKVNGGGVFQVDYKFAGTERSLSALREHDSIRHLQIIAGVDLPIGGTGRPDAVGLYYAKIGIGTPSKDYYVQVDTGSDIMWVNCINCQQCPTRGYRGLELTQYNPKDSLTGQLITCEWEFCKEIMRDSSSGCTSNETCLYTEVYGDGSFSMGYFVEDFVQYDRVSGDLQTQSANGSVIFGCGAGPSADLSSSDDALDGVLGFGKANSSLISQLASAGRVKNMFAHCLDGVNGGGIFAIGHVVQPKVNMTALVPNHVDDGFPPVTFHFGNSLNLTVYPHDYLFPFDGLMCVGWQNSGVLSGEKTNITLLGDLVLSNKLVLYDLENQTIGWTTYNCSSSIKLKDEITGSVHLVGAHSIPSCAFSQSAQKAFIFLLLMTLLQAIFTGL